MYLFVVELTILHKNTIYLHIFGIIQGTPLTSEGNRERLKWRALSLTSIASRHLFQGEPVPAVQTCYKLTELGPMIREAGLTTEDLQMPWRRLILGASQCESGRRDGTVVVLETDDDDDDSATTTATTELPCNLVYAVLNAMSTFPSDNNDEVYERLSNALVRRVLFLTGAVNMQGCPPPDRGEVAFIGRSNVGKSSLINMVRYRARLATIVSAASLTFLRESSYLDLDHQSQIPCIHQQNAW